MKTVFCYGDSNTFGYDPSAFSTGSLQSGLCWVDALGDLLKINTVNGGLNGRSIPSSDREIDALIDRMRSCAPIEVLIIMLGTNDLLSPCPPPSNILAERVRNLIEKVHLFFSDIPIVLISPPYLDIKALEGLHDALSNELLSIDRPYLHKVDLRTWQLPLMFDGIHFTVEAHRTFASELARILKNEYPAIIGE